MGFSVSGSAVVLFAGLLVAFGVLSTAAAEHQERVSGAEDAQSDRVLDVKNTAVTITDASWNGNAVNVDLRNDGSRSLRLSELSVVLDGTHETFSTSHGDLVRPGEVAQITVDDVQTQPTRVKAITALGLADTSGVTSSV
jgi:flagellar protein FlaF